MSREELIYCIERFIDKNDISIKNAQRIEILLDDLNSEEEIIESMIRKRPLNTPYEFVL